MRSASKMSESSFKTFIIKDSKLCSINNNFKLDLFNNPKNSFPNTYFPNGYIDIIKTKNILKNFIHGNKVLPYLTKGKIIDIDTLDDFYNACLLDNCEVVQSIIDITEGYINYNREV